MLEDEWRDSLLLGVSACGSSALIGTFFFYYLKVFIDGYHISLSSLSIIQFIFLIWNAVNDPLMGYAQDFGICGIEWIKDRRKVCLYAGPVFAASFLIFWFPWSRSSQFLIGSQLLFSLFVFDALLTMVMSSICSLSVEKTAKHSDRVRTTVITELCGTVAGFAILPVQRLSGGLDNMFLFRVGCCGIAVFAAICYIICGSFLSQKEKEPEEMQLTMQESELQVIDKEEKEASRGFIHILAVSLEIIRQPRFICLVGAQFFRLIRMMANEQFLVIFVERLLIYSGFLAKDSPYVAWYYVAVRSMGSVLFFFLWFPSSKLGIQPVLILTNIASLLNCFAILSIGRINQLAVAVFIIIENMFSRCGVYGYYTVIAGEVIDEDEKKNKRNKPTLLLQVLCFLTYYLRSPYSTTIFTLKALFTKPADQLAPLIMFLLLNSGGWSIYKDDCKALGQTGNATVAVNSDSLSSNCSSLYDLMFNSMVFFPLVCCISESFFLAIDLFLKGKSKNANMK